MPEKLLGFKLFKSGYFLAVVLGNYSNMLMHEKPYSYYFYAEFDVQTTHTFLEIFVTFLNLYRT